MNNWSLYVPKYGSVNVIEQEPTVLTSKSDIIVKPAFTAVGRLEIAQIYGLLPVSKRTPFYLSGESSGVITAVGPAVAAQGFAPGQAVSILSLQPCGICRACRTGNPNLCFSPKTSGTASEYVRLKPSQVMILPEGTPLDKACLLNSVNKAMYVFDRTRVRRGGSLLILGCHGLALILLQIARLTGVEKISLIGDDPNLCALARQYGANCVAYKGALEQYADITKLTDYLGYDGVIDTMVDPITSQFGFESLTKGGTFVSSSIAIDEINVSAAELCLKEVNISGCNEPTVFLPGVLNIFSRLDLDQFTKFRFSYKDWSQVEDIFKRESVLRILIEH